jgi:hypothetical protein
VVFNGSLVGLGSLFLAGSIGLGTRKFGTDKLSRKRVAAAQGASGGVGEIGSGFAG